MKNAPKENQMLNLVDIEFKSYYRYIQKAKEKYIQRIKKKKHENNISLKSKYQ